jgi:hypothetical protein
MGEPSEDYLMINIDGAFEETRGALALHIVSLPTLWMRHQQKQLH